METKFLVTPQFDKAYKALKKKYVSIKSDVEQFKKDFSENHSLGFKKSVSSAFLSPFTLHPSPFA
jgi:hypothetical protein